MYIQLKFDLKLTTIYLWDEEIFIRDTRLKVTENINGFVHGGALFYDARLVERVLQHNQGNAK